MNLALQHEPELISIKDYLEEEQEAEERHEYVDGRVYAMAGASEKHEIVAMNLAAALLAHLRGRGCRVFKGDMKILLRLHASELFYYPDIMIVCDPADNKPFYKERPRLIVEVMTDYKSDHVEKLFAYQQIPSLEEYLVIDQDPENPRAWRYRRDQAWAMEEAAPDGNLRLEAFDFQIPLRDLYVMQ